MSVDHSTVAIVGNPNTGKSSIFNALTGLRQHVGNWPGVTVERKEGMLSYHEREITLVDLPGIYSLGYSSPDEQVAADFVLKEKPSLVIAVADASNIERSLYLAVQLREIGMPMLLVLNMCDIAQQKGIRVDTERLGAGLGAPVLMVSARSSEGLELLKESIGSCLDPKSDLYLKISRVPLDIPYGEHVIPFLTELSASLARESACRADSKISAIRIAEGDERYLLQCVGAQHLDIYLARLSEQDRLLENRLGYDLQTAIIERRWAFLSGLALECVQRDLSLAERLSISEKIDRVVTHRLLGLPIFLLMAWLMFRLTYAIGDPVMSVISSIVGGLGHLADSALQAFGASDLIRSFVADGLVSGVGSVAVFFPHIFMLFFFIALLEDSGYLARGAFVMDRLMHALGLHGKSFIPMLMGFGCNVPAMMATRVLDRSRDRMLTLMVLPFMSCSARLPVLALFAGAFFQKQAGTVLFLCYVGGVLVAVFSAKLLGSLLFKGESSHLVMELPPYRIPTLRVVLLSAWERGSLFLKKMGGFIFIAMTLIWVGASFPVGVEYASPQSYIGRVGAFLAPLFAPLGFGFPTAALALLFGLAAKEVVLGTFGTLLGVGREGLSIALASYFTPASAAAFITLTLLYVPCVATIAAFKRESNSWKWTAFMVFYTLLVAYLIAWVVYRVMLML